MTESDDVQFINRKDIQLYLKTNKGSFIRAESVNLKAFLFNHSPYTIKVEDFSISNNSLQFSAENYNGGEFSGSLISPRVRDGLRINEVREKTLVAVEPKSAISIEVNLLSILGELPEGWYRARGTYSSGLLFIDSEPIYFRILKSMPVYAKTVKDYLRTDVNPVRTAWINKIENVLYLFIMQNSQYQPMNLRLNHKIMKVKDVQRISPSVLASPDLQTEHLIWTEKETISIAILYEKALKCIKEVKFLTKDLRVLEPAITDFDGKLHLIIVSKENGTSTFQLVNLSLQEEIKTQEVCRFDGDFTKYSVIYDEDLKVHLTWVSESGDVFYSWFCTDDKLKAQDKPKVLAKDMPPILDLQLSKACRDEEGHLQLLLNIVTCESSSKLHSRLIDVEKGREIFHSFHELPELKGLILLQTVLDPACRPHFLFQDSKGALWFKPFMNISPARVTQEGEVYPGNVDCPVLLVSSKMSHHYGIYLRYIKNKENFVYKKVESLA